MNLGGVNLVVNEFVRPNPFVKLTALPTSVGNFKIYSGFVIAGFDCGELKCGSAK